jgi:hypothetical protein
MRYPPPAPERIASLIPNARLAVMDNCGHWILYEDTEAFNRSHLDFEVRLRWWGQRRRAGVRAVVAQRDPRPRGRPAAQWPTGRHGAGEHQPAVPEPPARAGSQLRRPRLLPQRPQLADALDAGLRGRRDLDQALADYQRRRDAAVLPMYEFTCARAGLEPAPPQMQALLGALRDDPAATQRFFGVFAGTVPVHEFFGPPAQAA